MTLPEPPGDAAAQMAAVADPGNPKNTAFFGRGTQHPPIPAHLHTVTRPEGTLVTQDPAKAQAFAAAPSLHDGLMAQLLDYPESKSQVAASGAPMMVQGLTPQGHVAHEMAASPAGLSAALRQVQSIAPHARVTSVPQALSRRAGLLGL